MLVPLTLSDLEIQDVKVKLFLRISIITHQPFDLERPNAARNTCRRGMCFLGSDMSSSKGLSSTQREKQSPNCACDQTTCEENIYRVVSAHCRAKIVGDTNADVRSVCGSKHSCLFCITLTEHDACICVTFLSSSVYAVVV